MKCFCIGFINKAPQLYKKVKMSNGKYLYSFRNLVMASEQEVAYVQQSQKKETFDGEKYS